jgi:glycosyltransferase involved in cell wall biosynthesis
MEKLTVVVIARNEEDKIEDCLKSVKWATQIVVIDNASTDKTAEIAKKHKARVVKTTDELTLNYAELRNLGLEEAKEDWILYIDADERVTPELKRELQELVSGKSVYAIPRKNIILGREMKHGGWWPDYVKRLYKKNKLKGWTGELHEEPEFDGEMGHLTNPLVHHKHDKLSEMVTKTNKWSEKEAKLLLDAGHPRMSWWRFFRIMTTELWYRLIIKRAFLDGVEGVIYAIYLMWSKFITYGKLWEMQNARSNS